MKFELCCSKLLRHVWMDAHLQGCKCQSKDTILKVQAIKQKKEGVIHPLFLLSTAKMGLVDFILSFYMYALYAGDSAMAGRRTSLVLVSTVSNNPVGNRQSTFMDMSAAKKKEPPLASSFYPFFFWEKKKKRELELSKAALKMDGTVPGTYTPCVLCDSSWNRLSRDPSTFLPILQHF